jgi:hypothetical protein
MQHVEGKENVSVLRIFDACLNTEDAFTTKRLSVENMDTFEAVRFFFSQEEICASRNFYGEWKAISLTDANDYIALKTIILPWSYEDSKGTIFSILAEYGAYESWFDKRKISSGSDWYIVNLTHKMKDLSYNAFTLLTNHFAKDIFNSPMQAVKRVFRDRLEHSSLDKCLRDILGVESILAPNNLSLIEWISPVKKRHIGIYEKVMEKYLVGGKYSEIRESERSLYYIDQFLDWASDDELDFVNGINNEQYQDLLDTWVKSRSTTMVSAIYDSDLIYCIKILVKLCGIKNLKEYITYMFKTVGNLEYDLENASFSDYEDARIVFSDYINMYDRLVSGGFVLKKPKWRFKKYSELARAHDDILYLTQIKEERKLEMKEESYKKIKESYEKYKYSEDKYAVVPPASLKSIVNEGIALNHCVKTYIDKVLEQKTNILFIRRPEDLEKPFFTLEIKDGFVRQCHGFNNCNIDKAEGLEKFLERYCKEKDIAFSEIQADRILAVG